MRKTKYKLASRTERLWASLLDSVLVSSVMLIVLLALRFGSFRFYSSGSALIFIILLAGLTIVPIFTFQFYLLATKGQTIGKIWKKIKIVKIQSGKNGGFFTNVVLRAVVTGIIIGTPSIVIGLFLKDPMFRLLNSIFALLMSIADPLLIFDDAKRCLHDYIAGTVVVKAKR